MGRPPKKDIPPELADVLALIGENLRYFRQEKGWSQAELAGRCRVSVTTLNEIETRRFRDIRLSTLTALAATLGVPLVALFEGSDVEISRRDQAQLLKASDAIQRISKKIRTRK